MIWPGSLLLLGAGKMGGAMLDGWLARGLAGSAVTIIDPHVADEVAVQARRQGVRINPPASERIAPEVLIVAVKPQMLTEAAAGISALAGSETLVISIAAGKRIADLGKVLPGARAFVRAMPNTPAAVGRGITGVVASAEVSERQRQLTEGLLSAVGAVEWVASEALIDAVTAVSGSGPAYVFYLVECLAQAGIETGLEPDTARRLARATVEGAAELMFRQPDVTPAQLRINVTSPGGTTAAALAVLMADDGLGPLMTRAVAAARHRAEELGG